jgi:hypothetical protein
MFKVERERSYPKIERGIKMKIYDIERERQARNPDSKRHLLVEAERGNGAPFLADSGVAAP